MTISSVIGGSTPPVAAAKTGKPTLGQADFLKLLTTQLSQQDPTDPVDNKEMVAQMAQFSSLAGISEMNDTLKAIATKLDVVLSGQAKAEKAAAKDSSGDTPA